jgi:pheromone shutdown protein TraB
MDHDLGGIGLINWQGRRYRRIKPSVGAGLWTAVLVICGLLAVAMLTAQAVGWLRWTGVLALLPAALALLALSSRLVALVRGALGWLAA